MVSFIHIADKNDEQAILRNGIKALKRRAGIRGVYATPVVPNFVTTHQWSRELKRRGIAGKYMPSASFLKMPSRDVP